MTDLMLSCHVSKNMIDVMKFLLPRELVRDRCRGFKRTSLRSWRFCWGKWQGREGPPGATQVKSELVSINRLHHVFFLPNFRDV